MAHRGRLFPTWYQARPYVVEEVWPYVPAVEYYYNLPAGWAGPYAGGVAVSGRGVEPSYVSTGAYVSYRRNIEVPLDPLHSYEIGFDISVDGTGFINVLTPRFTRDNVDIVPPGNDLTLTGAMSGFEWGDPWTVPPDPTSLLYPYSTFGVAPVYWTASPPPPLQSPWLPFD